MKQNEENVPVINHNNINPKRHLNRSKFHFINYGNSVFVKNIRKVLSNLIWRDGRSNSKYMQNSFSLSISPQNSLDISESSNIFEDDRNKMQILKHFNTWTSLVAHLNINSFRKKFEMVVETITNVDIFLISETKIDLAFANMQFKINRYKLFRRDRNRFGERLMLDLNEEIPCKLLNTHLIVPTCRFSGCCI